MALRPLPRTTRLAYRVARHVPRSAWPPPARLAYRAIRIAPHVVPHVPGTARRHRRHGGDPRVFGPRPAEAEEAARHSPLLGVLPLWVAPAVADWWIRRRTPVDTRESAVHALRVAEAGVPLVLGLVARINPLVLTVMTGAAALHCATAAYDASPDDRAVRPTERYLHTLLNTLPLTTLILTASHHPDQLRATLHGGPGPHDWHLQPKKPPLPTPYLLALGATITAGVVLPYTEELRRSRRASREAREK
ncbi:hypothetical protein [Streptomyces sp. LaPpAH-108]|uniref:hypothetical protein n=1 Tax=Streptomyces sp. LaPpAH-108 TaxID=1155714 RepID=UPI00035DA074|nr:hypothetical protein [Streptomyces sp. LaPpAH-108]